MVQCFWGIYGSMMVIIVEEGLVLIVTLISNESANMR